MAGSSGHTGQLWGRRGWVPAGRALCVQRDGRLIQSWRPGALPPHVLQTLPPHLLVWQHGCPTLRLRGT